MPSSYPVPWCAVPVSAGMMVAVPLELAASPLKSGRDLGGGDRSALVIGGTEKIRTGGAVVFCKVVAVTEAQVKRDGQVRAKGSPVHHATLGPLEERLESQAGPGVAGGIAGRAPLDARFVKGERERLLATAFMIRVIVLMTLMPRSPHRGRDRRAGRGPGPGAVGAAVAAGVGAGGRGLAERARPGPPGRTAGPRAGSGLARAPGAGLPGAVTIGKGRPLRAGSLDGTLLRVPDTPANRAFFGTVGTGDDSGPYPCLRALPLTCCSCRALFAMPHGPAGTDKAAAEQKLLDEAMECFPALLDPGWIWLMDRN